MVVVLGGVVVVFNLHYDGAKQHARALHIPLHLPCCFVGSMVRTSACIVMVVFGLISPKCLSNPVVAVVVHTVCHHNHG